MLPTKTGKHVSALSCFAALSMTGLEPLCWPNLLGNIHDRPPCRSILSKSIISAGHGEPIPTPRTPRRYQYNSSYAIHIKGQDPANALLILAHNNPKGGKTSTTAKLTALAKSNLSCYECKFR